jgi:hypothetical protein
MLVGAVGPPHSYEFVSKLIDRQVDEAKRASANLLFDEVLVDPVLRSPIILTGAVLGSRIQSLLHGRSCQKQRPTLANVL